jgi:peptidoglycan hydrolase CwlO-like protein
MKKVLFIAFIATAVCFASCGNKTQKAAEADTVAVAEEDNFTTALKAALDNKDAASLQAAIEAAQVKIAELTKEGKLEEAKAALVSVQTWLKDNAETVKSVTGDNEAINTLIEKVQAIPAESVDAIQNLGAQTESTANDMANKANDALEKGKQKVEEKANEAVEKGKEKAREKAKEEVNKAADKALNKLGL